MCFFWSKSKGHLGFEVSTMFICNISCTDIQKWVLVPVLLIWIFTSAICGQISKSIKVLGLVKIPRVRVPVSQSSVKMRYKIDGTAEGE